MNNQSFDIIKSSGKREPFSIEKYLRSLKHVGLNDAEAQEVLSKMQEHFKPGISTRELYVKTFNLLKNTRQTCASRYALKEALRLLGPSGFPFEKLISAVLARQGFKVITDVILNGKCIDHEIDVCAQKDGGITFVEAKFHNLVGTKSDVKTALYVKARFDDLRAAQENVTGGLLVTNTQFTSKAIQYGECAGIGMLAWGYPYNQGLERLIDHYRLYPITVLVSLKARERRLLLDAGITMCQDLENPDVIKKLNDVPISRHSIEILQGECKRLCNYHE